MSSPAPKPRILAVDDSRVMRVAMKKILGNDYDVIEAEHGEDAWTLLINDQSIQVVFTDLSMPYLDGFGLLERMRNAPDERLQEIPVIIVTGKEDDDASKQRALDKGASDFISKPFESVQLLARAKAHLKFNQKSSQLIDIAGKMEKQAAIDELTGLGGQRYFYKAAEESIAAILRHGGHMTLIRMDLDDFNLVFIKNGKGVADAILKNIGHQLLKQVRKEDMLARVGLAKFALLLRNTPRASAEQLAERIRHSIAHLQFNVGQHEKLRLTASFGLYEPNIKSQSDIKKLLAVAEQGVNEATMAGGNRLVIKSDEPQPNPDLVNLETALAYIKRGEQTVLSPQVNSLLIRVLPLLKYLGEQLGGEIKILVDKLTDHQP